MIFRHRERRGGKDSSSDNHRGKKKKKILPSGKRPRRLRISARFERGGGGKRKLSITWKKNGLRGKREEATLVAAGRGRGKEKGHYPISTQRGGKKKGC